ncbi:hypothetical protein MO867_08045 [Microbulbifer sp. OS29]|uniref:Uncharacterized protein n=1 Tax=Microbulbifer okhotskensis TaxID=2926617 RepID=A0A9X2EL88_9GAMM|nr:sigma factor [Microbulbifer okhotskensis]MCO1334294.1 hypothetical protein [Microbulbifer okhotskensis]
MSVDQYQKWLRICTRLYERPQQAEDLLQDGLLAATEAQRLVLSPALNGLTRSEMRKVLNLSDTGLRQRLSGLRKKLASPHTSAKIDPTSLTAAYAAQVERANSPRAVPLWHTAPRTSRTFDLVSLTQIAIF